MHRPGAPTRNNHSTDRQEKEKITMRSFANQQSELTESPQLSFRKKHKLALSALVSLILLASSSFVSAQQHVVNATPGWDIFGKLSKGQVIYNLTGSRGGRGLKLQITYILRGAEPNQSCDVAFGVFNLPGDGMASFGVPRIQRGTFTREGVTATNDAFIVGKFVTNSMGNGETHVTIDLAGVPPGSYDVQFTWTQRTDSRALYRTGRKYGQGFARIVVP
jgi:hypothetical protein